MFVEPKLLDTSFQDCQVSKQLIDGNFANSKGAPKKTEKDEGKSVACQTGRSLDAQANPQWSWKGRNVYMFDGTTVSMPDAPANQSAYPQPDTQKPGLGFPMARFGTITSLACGAILNLSFCRYAGKGQSEVGLLRSMWDILSPGDVLLTDCLMPKKIELVGAEGLPCGGQVVDSLQSEPECLGAGLCRSPDYIAT